MTVYTTTKPDQAWLSLIASRRAVLWFGQSCRRTSASNSSVFVSIAAHSWHSIYIDGGDLGIDLAEEVDASTIDPLTLRTVDQDPDATKLAPNRIPMYAVPPAGGAVATLTRLKMLQRIPAGVVLFAVISGEEGDLGCLREALEVSPEVAELVVIGPAAPSADLKIRRCVHWTTQLSEFDTFLGSLAAPKDVLRQSATIALATESGIRPVDLSRAIDPSSSLLERFELIPSDQVLVEVPPSDVLVEQLLSGPTNSWRPYAARIPFDRTGPYRAPLRGAIKEFVRRGPEATCTAWLEAEQASGATTLIRSIAYGLACEGLPVLLARPGAVGFDFQQLSAFLRTTAPILDEAGGHRGELPWIIVFDADHAARDDEFLAGVANGLRKLGHLAIVLAIRPVLPSMPRAQVSAHGPSLTLGPRLPNVVGRSEAEALGQHLNKILPPHQRRASSDWLESLRQPNDLREKASRACSGSRSVFGYSGSPARINRCDSGSRQSSNPRQMVPTSRWRDWSKLPFCRHTALPHRTSFFDMR